MKTNPNSTVEKVKAFIRQPYAWPGGYPLYLVMSDSEAVCKKCAKTEFSLILSATKDKDESGWQAEGVDVNWEDNELYCSHCGEQIESAYGEPDNEVDA